jgi:hypothetical protein
MKVEGDDAENPAVTVVRNIVWQQSRHSSVRPEQAGYSVLIFALAKLIAKGGRLLN